MQAQDVITPARALVNDPSSAGRFSDTTFINFLNIATQELIRDVEFPESRLTTNTVANQQEYPTPELIKVYRVYLAGQIIVQTTLASLEGRQILDYDQGVGATQNAPVAGSGGPPGAIPGFLPSWVAQAPEVYPVSNAWGNPAPDGQEWNSIQRPRYYFRGGSIGLVPAPANIVTLTVECLAVPPQILNLTDILVFPSNFKQALIWKLCELCKFSDDSDTSAEARNNAMQKYNQEMRSLRTLRKTYEGDSPQGPKFRTNRTGRGIGNNRGGWGWQENDF